MDLEQLLLVKLAEECQEVAKVALKAGQFGVCTQIPGTDLCNRTLLTNEIMDLEATIQLIRERSIHDDEAYVSTTYRPNKQARIGHYALVSQSKGRSQFDSEELEFIERIISRES